MKIRIGLIGSGYMAREYLKASTVVDAIDIVSIFSRNYETASILVTEFNVPNVAKSFGDFADLDLDFLIVCVPELATAKIIATFATLKIPMLVEKPVGLTLAEALEIESFSAEQNLSIFAALNRRFYSSSQQVFSELSTTSGKRIVRITDQENTLAASAAGQPEEVVRNWMFANSIHIIDFISVICRGEPSIQYRNWIELNSDAYVVQAGLRYSSGDEAFYTGYWNSPSGWSVDINTSEKAWQLSPLEVARWRRNEDRQYREFVTSDLDVNFKPGIVQMLIELVKCAKGNAHNLTSISEANRTMRLIDLIYPNE